MRLGVSVAVIGALIGAVTGWAPQVCAAARPVKQLPSDLARWSMLWAVVPQQMYEVGHEEGPLGALTWGPVKGTVSLVWSTLDDLMRVMRSEEGPGGRPQPRGASGLVVRYEF